MPTPPLTFPARIGTHVDSSNPQQNNPAAKTVLREYVFVRDLETS